MLSVVVCIVLAAISAAVLPTVPSYDPWSWVVWGREVFDPHLSFIVNGGPSWKPLPVMFTAVWGLFGGAAPTLWVITARVGGLLGLVGAWRLGNRLAGGRWPGAVAGLLAVAGVVLTQEWVYYFLRGTSEVILIGATLWAIDRLLEGRRGQAFLLALAASLIRPEWWPFIGLYALWLWFRDPAYKTLGRRALLALGLVTIPFFWFAPPGITTGQPFLAATHASEYNGHLGAHVFTTVIARGVNLQVLPALIAGALCVLIGWVRDRDRLLLALAAAILAWWVVVVGMTLDGYPGLERFFLPAAALTCVLGGVGIVRIAQLAGALAGRAGRGGGAAVAVTVVVAVVLVAVSIPFSSTRISEARAAVPAANAAVRTLDELTQAVAVVGGHRGVYPCHSSFAAVNHGAQTALAWKLHVTLERVGTTMHAPGVDFIGPHNATNGEAAPVDPRLTRHVPLGRAGVWRMVQVTDPRLPTACDGR